jgi:iron complex outermembrane receptor protein
MRHILSSILLVLAIFVVRLTPAYSEDTSFSDLNNMSLEDLLQISVTSASKREQSLNDVASAVYVISEADIRRSPATTIPELLRMVPGLYVAQVNAHTWAITARGFGGVFTNKLLVLIDGRSVYSPLYSGTYWDIQDYPLQDIERIEVVRGPGGTLWGSNAVNGVINITTKKAKQSKGVLASISSGKETNLIGDVRYGHVEGDTAARIYARGRVIDHSVRADGGAGDDGYSSGQAGFRAEQALGDTSSLTVQGDLYSLNTTDRLVVPSTLPPFASEEGQQSAARGGNILARFNSDGFSKEDKFSAQFYFDRAIRDDLVARTSVNTYDLDTQYEWHLFDNHTIVTGGGIRSINDSIGERALVRLDKAEREYHLVNGFIEDEYQIIPQKWSITGGVKFEHNEFTGGAWQPSFKTTLHPAEDVTLWGSVSRAVRIPSRVTNDVRIPLAAIPPNEQVPLPTSVQLTGSTLGGPEWVTSYDTGLRTKLGETLSIDTTFFFADYTDIETFDQGEPQIVMDGEFPSVIQPLNVQNNGKATARGIETVFNWTPCKEANIQFWHTFQIIRGRVVNGSTDTVLPAEDKNNPVNQFGLRAQIDLPGDFEFNPFVRFVENVPTVDVQSYIESQLQLAYRASDTLRVSLNFNNILNNEHLEYRSEFLQRPSTKVERAFFLNLTYQY